MTEKMLTIAEASIHLGISERTLRRILRAPEMAAKMQAEYRQTRTGQRRSALVPKNLLFAIAETLNRKPGENKSKNSSETLAEMTFRYERLLAEKDARILELTKALEHEREQSQRHADAHAQAQKLIPSPETPRQTLLERVLKHRK